MNDEDLDVGINGSPNALGVDRAILELRRGRAIAIEGDGRTLVVAALETAADALIGQLLGASERVSAEAFLLVTPERAQAAGLNGSSFGPVAAAIAQPADPDALRARAGVAAAAETGDDGLVFASWPGSRPLAAAGFSLAKAARLIPALIAFESARCEDLSVSAVTLDAVRESGEMAHRGLTRIAQSRLPLSDAEDASITLFRDPCTDGEHVAIVIGDPAPGAAVPVRMHSACLTGDVLGSLRCDCGEQLQKAVLRIAELGAGVLLYLDQEGRGIGLANKLRAYSIQDSGLDTLDADRHLGFSSDERSYDVAAAMLQLLGITSIEIMTNNPAKIAALRAHGIEVVGRVPLVGSTNTHNEKYLRAKRERAGHLDEGAADGAPAQTA